MISSLPKSSNQHSLEFLPRCAIQSVEIAAPPTLGSYDHILGNENDVSISVIQIFDVFVKSS